MVHLAKSIRNITAAPIIIGNAHPSILPGDFIYDRSPFDIAVCGEGEATRKEILANYLVHADLTQIKGIAHFNDEEQVTVTPERKLIPAVEWGE